MTTATPIPNSITLAEEQTLPNGVRVAQLSYDGTTQQFLDAPAAIKIGEVAYGKSSHNSDTYRITYRTDKIYAVKA
jgi:hypothetical protein